MGNKVKVFSKGLLVLLLLFGSVILAVNNSWAENYSFYSNQFVILGENDQLPSDIQQNVEALGGMITRIYPQIGVAVASSNSATFAEDVEALSGIRSCVPDAEVQWIEPNPRVETISMNSYGNPPNSGDDDFFFDLQWGHDAVNAPEAWNMGARGAGARVYVLDSGIDAEHPDIAPNLNTALCTSFVPGEDWNVRPGFYFNHGTHVAGIIAAADNGWGTIGVAPEAELVAVKVLSEYTGSGAFSWVIAGIMYAADHGADVINMSLGALLPRNHYFLELREALARATTYAFEKGATIVAAAGNNGVDIDASSYMFQPAESPKVLGVSATAPFGWAVDFTASLDDIASYTNYGQSIIRFAGPGGDWDYYYYDPSAIATVGGLTRPVWIFDMVFSDIPGGWAWAAGTSMASPYVAGVAAIVIGRAGGAMNPDLVRIVLRRSADDLGEPGFDPFYGWGRVNAFRAVGGVGSLAEQPVNDASLQTTPRQFALLANYPNPFNPTTTISYQLPEETPVKLTIYNVQGQLVRAYDLGIKTAGTYSVEWDGKDQFGRDLPSGTYLYRIKAGTFEQTRKMLLLK